MLLVGLYSFLLVAGVVFSQVADLSAVHGVLETVTIICLAHIMLEVGLEFTLDKSRIKGYAWDYVVAATAAAFPWIICIVYFMVFFQMNFVEASLLGRFAAPTSAGILFAMLAAAGLGTTWLFRKARVLAIFDDLDTVLMLIPLQIILVGFKLHLLLLVVIMCGLLGVAYRWLHRLRLPVGKVWLLVYGTGIVFFTEYLEHTTHVELEILLPAFVLGCLLYNPHDPNKESSHQHEHQYLEPDKGWPLMLDHIVKGGFMFLVGCSLPKIAVGDVSWGVLAVHVMALTVLINLGKCFPVFCYRKEAGVKERLALSVAMFPRGEVGAGVLLIAVGYNISGLPVTLSVLCLALNLLMTGVFISLSIHLIKK